MYPGQLRAPEEKPKSAMVFGILNIIFGSWGLLGLLMGLIILIGRAMSETQRQIQLPPYIQLPMLFIGFGLSLFLLINGISLLRATMSARKGFLVYCAIAVIYKPVAGLISVVHMFSKMPALTNVPNSEAARTIMTSFMVISAVFGILGAIAYPLVGLIFFTRPGVVKKFKAYNRL
jgi:hypothetical protein